MGQRAMRDADRLQRTLVMCTPRRHQTRHFRKRATSVPAEGPAYGLDSGRHCEFPLRTPQAQKWHVHRSGTFVAACIHTYLLTCSATAAYSVGECHQRESHCAVVAPQWLTLHGAELHEQGHMTTGHRLFCKELLCFSTVLCRHMPSLAHF